MSGSAGHRRASGVSFGYSGNKNGHVAGEVRTEGGMVTVNARTYDARGELSRFQQSTGYGETCSYDKAGNMTGKVLAPAHGADEEAEAVILKMRTAKNIGNAIVNRVTKGMKLKQAIESARTKIAALDKADPVDGVKAAAIMRGAVKKPSRIGNGASPTSKPNVQGENVMG